MGILKNAIDSATLNVEEYDLFLRELRVAKPMALINLVNNDTAVKTFVQSKLYYIFKSGTIPYKDRYSIYLKSIEKGVKPINLQLFLDIMDFGGDLNKSIKEVKK